MSTIGRFTILRNLGSNEVETLLARDEAGAHVVIKRPLRENAAAFSRDARLAAKLEHDHIIRTVEVVDEPVAHVTELVHGEDVREVLAYLSRQKVSMPLGHVLAIGIAVADALHHAHELRGTDKKPLGIVHRTLSPSTIIVGHDGTIRVTDFASVQRGSHLGYWSPEQVKDQPIDRRSDIWSLGVVLYELATQTRLWRGPEADVRAAIAGGKVPMPRVRRPELPNEISMIIMRALAVDPARRFQKADELRNALAQLATGEFEVPPKKLASFMRKLFGERPELWRDGAFEARNSGPITLSPPTGGSQPRGEWSTSFTRADVSGAFPRVELGTRSSSPGNSGPVAVSRANDTGPQPISDERPSRPSRPNTLSGETRRPSRPSKPPGEAIATDWNVPIATTAPAPASSKKTFAIAIGGIAVVAILGVVAVTAMGGKSDATAAAATTTVPSAGSTLDPNSMAMPITPAAANPTTAPAAGGRDLTVPRPPPDKKAIATPTTKPDETPATNDTPTPTTGTGDVEVPVTPVTPEAPAPVDKKPEAQTVAMLSQATIDGLARDHANELSGCKSTDVHGAITINFEIDATGKVVSSQISSTVGKPQLAGCILRTLGTWAFPHPPTGKARGAYTLTYP